MKFPEKELTNILIDLKENYCAAALKVEFETETIADDEILMLKKISELAGLDFIVKIGGCGAVKDLFDVMALGANIIVAPMIETSYALEKFVCTVNSVFPPEECSNLKLFINIETKQGFYNLDDIFNSEYLSLISGIVVGRSDLAKSLGFGTDDINGDEILEYTNQALSYAIKYKKEFIVGGNISSASLPFLNKISQKGLTKFETRKIVFNADLLKDEANTKDGIIKAIDFELLWLENCIRPDEKRFNLLQERQNIEKHT